MVSCVCRCVFAPPGAPERAGGVMTGLPAPPGCPLGTQLSTHCYHIHTLLAEGGVTPTHKLSMAAGRMSNFTWCEFSVGDLTTPYHGSIFSWTSCCQVKLLNLCTLTLSQNHEGTNLVRD